MEKELQLKVVKFLLSRIILIYYGRSWTHMRINKSSTGYTDYLKGLKKEKIKTNIYMYIGYLFEEQQIGIISRKVKLNT